MKLILHLVMPAVLLAVAGCSGDRPAGSYFPLEAGHRWTYTLSSEWENNTTEREDLVLSSLGEESLPAGGSAWRRRSESSVDYWLRSDASGVYRVATKTDVEEEPKVDAEPRFVLKLPLVVGTSWQASTAPYLLRRNNEFPPEIRHTHPVVPMTYRIDAIAQSVDTPAGHFDGCLRVRGEGSVKLFADPVQGWRDMPLTTLEWYCPGVGLVRVERNEPANSTFLMGGVMKMELKSWQ